MAACALPTYLYNSQRMKQFGLALLVVVVAQTAAGVRAQTRPRLADYFTTIPLTVLDAGYAPSSSFPVTADINGDGHQDLIVLGAWYPGGGRTCCTPQPARVFLGDGDGHFSPAPANLFPVDTIRTVHPRKVLFADFNTDGRPDMFISSHGWDTDPFPGEQNRLYLSRPEGGWRDATANLPQVSDFSHTSAAGDISGRGVIDIFVGNGYFSSRVAPYFLLNTGSGQFSQTRTNIPAGNNQLLGFNFAGATLADLDGDALPELIVTADSSSSAQPRRTTILWNRAGVFSEADTTQLPLPGIFGNTHIDLDVQPIDVNQDGLPDLVLVGTQGAPFYDGWFVQILVNKGNRQFVDETALRLAPGEVSGGREGLTANAPWPIWVRGLDFNQDGALDFTVDFQGHGFTYSQDLPLVWINDGAGHFSALKVGDFVVAGSEALIGGRNPSHLVATRNGYSFINPLLDSRDLRVTGLLATRPYRLTGVTSNVSFPPSNETNDFNTQLENLYRDRLGANRTSASVDLEGANVWLTEYARYRVGLCTHFDAMTRVFEQINTGVVSAVCAITPAGAVPFPPRSEGLDFMNQLDEVYRDRLRRSPSPVYVNNEGRVVWILEYLRYRLNSCSHGDATMRVFQQILGQGIQPTCS